jgi:hypothetical protein
LRWSTTGTLADGDRTWVLHQVFIVGTGVHWILGFGYAGEHEAAALPVIEQIVASFRSKVEAWE